MHRSWSIHTRIVRRHAIARTRTDPPYRARADASNPVANASPPTPWHRPTGDVEDPWAGCATATTPRRSPTSRPRTPTPTHWFDDPPGRCVDDDVRARSSRASRRPTSRSGPARRWWYSAAPRRASRYPIHCRGRVGGDGDRASVLLDENAEAGDHDSSRSARSTSVPTTSCWHGRPTSTATSTTRCASATSTTGTELPDEAARHDGVGRRRLDGRRLARLLRPPDEQERPVPGDGATRSARRRRRRPRATERRRRAVLRRHRHDTQQACGSSSARRATRPSRELAVADRRRGRRRRPRARPARRHRVRRRPLGRPLRRSSPTTTPRTSGVMTATIADAWRLESSCRPRARPADHVGRAVRRATSLLHEWKAAPSPASG